MGNYTDEDTVAAALHIDVGDSDDMLRITSAIDAAESEVEAFCGRRFWQDAAVATREFYPESSTRLDLLDQPDFGTKVEISTTTGLIVKLDTSADGTFATTLTITTDFLLLPRNAAADSRPWSEILLVGSYTFPRLTDRAACQVTAKFGWATIPEAVKAASVQQAIVNFKSTDTPFGAASLGDTGTVYLRTGLHPAAKQMLMNANLARPAIG